MFVKLFGSILDSSIWSTDLATRVVWITMLAMADEFGVVNASVGGLARRAQVTERECRRALKILSSPDKDDRSGVDEGVRIRPLQGAWELINYKRYRELRTKKQVVDAARQARHRHAQRRDGRDTPVTPVTSHDVTVEAEAEGEAEAETSKSKALVALPRDEGASRGNGKHGQPLQAVIQELQDVGLKTDKRLSKDVFRGVMVKIVFSYWGKRLGHDEALFDQKRERVIRQRLVENQDNLSELLWAIDGALKDDWVMGRDPKSQKRFDGIENIFQDRAHVEKYAASIPQYRSKQEHPMAIKYAR